MPTRIIVNGEAIAEEDILAEIASIRASLGAHGGDLTLEERVGLRQGAINAVIERTL